MIQHGKFSFATQSALAAWQTEHFDCFGRSLKPDGVLGPLTIWSLCFESIPFERRAGIWRGLQFLKRGLKEVPAGSNDDPNHVIDGFLAFAGVVNPASWCASAVSDCLNLEKRYAVAQELGRAFPLVNEAACGDVFWYPTDGWRGHVTIILGSDDEQVMVWNPNHNNMLTITRYMRKQGFISRIPYPINDECFKVPVIINGVPLIDRVNAIGT